MQSFKRRVLTMVAAAIVTAACGTAAGYLLGRSLTLHTTAGKLRTDASRILAKTGIVVLESNATLSSIGASKYPFCSEAEVLSFRKLILRSEFLKDAGRMSNGRIQCSATLGRDDLPVTVFKPDMIQADGTKLYVNLPPFQTGKQTMTGMERGGAFLVFSPNMRDFMGGLSWQYIVTVLDAPGRPRSQLGSYAGMLSGKVTEEEGEGSVSKTLYATRCSPLSNDCVTAFVPVSEALESNRTVLVGYAALGGLAGAGLGLSLSLIYRRSRSMARQLRRAIARDKLQLVYQPIVNLATGRTEGAEALARWTDEEGYAVSPDVFIRIAEERGFIGSITRLVVRRALRDFGATLNEHPEFQLAVNVTGSDLADPGFQQMLKGALAGAGVAATSLTIEITESSTAMRDVAIRTIRQLRQRGHRVHIDDFGTGYSSLSYLQDLAVDAIKIDRSFTVGVGTGAANVAILPKILGMADELKLDVVVEGIETEVQGGYFAAVGKPMWAQGWLFGRPLPIDEFLQRLGQGERDASASLVDASLSTLASAGEE